MRPDPISSGPPSRDGGQTLPLVALLVAMVAGLALLIALLGGAVVERNRAKNAADAAALAGAVEGEVGARRVASANGAALERFVRLDPTTVEVTVRAGRHTATSRAAPTVTATAPTRSGRPGDPRL